MKLTTFCSIVVSSTLLLSTSLPSHATSLITQTQQLSAQDLDPALPKQPLEKWLSKHLPLNYQLSWRNQTSNCGENDNSNQDRPQCVEIEIKKGKKTVGLLALLVATEKQGPLKEGASLYHGHIDYLNTTHQFRQLSDVLQLNVSRAE